MIIHPSSLITLGPGIETYVKTFLRYSLLGFFQITFDSRQKVVVMIDTCRCSEVGLLYIFCRVAFARALCPCFVALDAWQGACACRTARALVLRLIDVAICVSLFRALSCGRRLVIVRKSPVHRSDIPDAAETAQKSLA